MNHLLYVILLALLLGSGPAAAVTLNDEAREAIAAFERGDFEAARSQWTAILDHLPHGDSEGKAIAAFFLMRSLDALDRTMDIAERVSLLDVDALPEAFHGDAIALVMKANLIRLKQKAALAPSDDLPAFLTPAEYAKIQSLRGQALRGGVDDDRAAMAAFAEAIFLGGYDAEQSVRSAFIELGKALRESGRLAEAETISRIQQALAIPETTAP